MSFKKSSRPEYRLQLPITKKRIAYTSFNMATERVLMLASQGSDPVETQAAIINTVNDHIQTAGVSCDDLCAAETMLLLQHMRSKSVGETTTINITDPDNPEKSYERKVDINDTTVVVDPEFTDKVTISDGSVIKLRIPTLSDVGAMFELNEDVAESVVFDTMVEVIAGCVICVADEDEVYQASDASPEEVQEFILSLDRGDFMKLQEDFLSRMPKLVQRIEVTRPDGTTFVTEVEGVSSFR